MNLDRFLNLLATSLGALGSIFVLKSFLRMKPRLIADLATPRWGYSLVVLDSLAAQRADSVAGAGAFAAAFVLGFISLAVVPSGHVLFHSQLIGLLLVGIGLIVAVLTVAIFASRAAKTYHIEARRFIIEAEFDSLIKNKSFTYHHTDGLRQSAQTLLGA